MASTNNYREQRRRLSNKDVSDVQCLMTELQRTKSDKEKAEARSNRLEENVHQFARTICVLKNRESKERNEHERAMQSFRTMHVTAMDSLRTEFSQTMELSKSSRTESHRRFEVNDRNNAFT